MRRALPLALLLALGARSVLAGEDGGTTSIFATGAGGRALAMGSAFTAVANDASGVYWNPGGLGVLTRLELQVSHSARSELGFSETAGVLAVPSWRWGTAALTFRHFGAGDIERRDDRNVLLDGGLSDAESEIGVAFGHAMGPAWSVGGTVKLQHQSLAGFSATGLGLDLGVLVRPAAFAGLEDGWARRVLVGLAARNLVEPALRLDQERVPDPMLVRSGLSYEHEVAGRTLRLALDVARPRDAAIRLHSGAELELHPMLALRAGLDRGQLTAGTRLHWRDLAIDYAFENEEGGTVQHFGLVHAFGATVAESRIAAQRREEQALQARLDEEFRRRLDAQVGTLVARADTFLSAGRFDDALEQLASAAALDPSRTDVAPRQIAALRGKATQLERHADFSAAAGVWARLGSLAPGDTTAAAAQRRCQLESDRRAARSQDLRARYSRALDALAANDLVTARDGFAAILALEPKDRDASALAARTRQAIQERVASLLEQAQRRLEAKDQAGAEALIARARALDPSSQGVARTMAALLRLRMGTTERPAPVAAEPAARPLTASQRKDLEDLYRRGARAIAEGRNDDALRYWELVWSMSPGYERVAEFLEREYQVRGMEAFSSGRYEPAIALWEKALAVDPGDPRTLGYVARAQTQLERTRKIVGGVE